jgi:CBS domain-containing protein
MQSPRAAPCCVSGLAVFAGSLVARPVQTPVGNAWCHGCYKEASLNDVQTILSRKDTTVFTVEPTASIECVSKSLTDHGVGALIVSDTEGRTVGIVSERDIVRALSAMGGAALETPVAEVMTRKVTACSRQDKLVEVMERMTEGKLRHLPVIENEQLLGIVSIRDVVKSRRESMGQEANASREYIGKLDDLLRQIQIMHI